MLELVAGTVSKGRLADDPDHEAACDHIGAMASLDPLGSALLRYRDAGDATMRGPLLRLLQARIWKRREPKMMMRKLCDHALSEHMHPTCTRCRGKGSVESLINNKRTVLCKRCNGSGLAVHNVQARMRALRISIVVYEMKWQELFARAHQELSSAEGNASRILARQLERNKRVD